MSRTAENQFMVTMRARFTIAVMRALVIAVAFQPVLGAGAVGAQVLDPVAEQITVTAGATATPLPHFWEQMFGSGRAILSLRESYRQDLRAVRAVTAFRYVRFHNILHDEVGVYGLDAKGRAKYNFSYVDQIYDGLLENGIRPFVEISFMPRALSSDRTSEMDFGHRPRTMRAGTIWCEHSSRIWSTAMASTRWRSGISRSGTSPISISGAAARSSARISHSMITPRAT
jgi:hypothetical protein